MERFSFLVCLDFSSSFHTPWVAGSLLQCRRAPVCSRAFEGAFWILRWTEIYALFWFQKKHSCEYMIYYFVSAYNLCIIYSVNYILLYMFIPIYLPYKFQTTWGRLRPGLLRCFREWPGPALCRQRPLQWSPGCLGSCTELCWSYGLCRCHGVFTMGEMHSWWCMGYVM